MFLWSVTLLCRFKRQKLHCLLLRKNCWRHFFYFSNEHHMKTGIEQLFTYMQWSTRVSYMGYFLCHGTEHITLVSPFTRLLFFPFFFHYNNFYITLTWIFNDGLLCRGEWYCYVSFTRHQRAIIYNTFKCYKASLALFLISKFRFTVQ